MITCHCQCSPPPRQIRLSPRYVLIDEQAHLSPPSGGSVIELFRDIAQALSADQESRRRVGPSEVKG